MKINESMVNPATNQSVTVRKNWLIISVTTMLMTIVWVGSGIYFALKKSSLPEVQTQRTLSFSTELNDSVFDLLRQRHQISSDSLIEEDRVKIQAAGSINPTIETSVAGNKPD